MGLSKYSLEKIGFELIPENVQIEAYFKSISVFQITGITSGNESHYSPEYFKKITEDYSFSIGESINDISKVLIGEDFTDNEENFIKEKRISPPYLVILISLNQPEICSHGYWKHKEKKIITYDCFLKSKEMLKEIEKKRTSMLITSLSAILSSDKHPVSFIPVTKQYFAETNQGKRLEDLNFKMTAKLSINKQITQEELSLKIEESINLYKVLDPKIGYFFSLAIKEKDNLKQFIYYFLMLEVYTHRSYKELSHNFNVNALYNIPKRIVISATEFFSENREDSKNLLQRFIWCSIIKWENITDSDIDQFKSYKKLRDKLYHGEEIDEKLLPIEQIKLLALKLLRSY